MLLSPNPLAHRGVLFLLTVCVVSAAFAGVYKLQPAASASTFLETTVAPRVLETSALAPASTIVVNSTADVQNNSDGLCTLREAIGAANTDTASGPTAGECAAGSGSDTIDLTGVTGTITLTSALPAIATDMTLTGPSASQLTVSGNNSVRVFYITLSGPGIVNFSGLTISNGLATMDVGGGIYNQNTATVNVSDSTISNNSAVLGGGLANSSTGPFTITNCTLTGNSAGTAGGIYNGLGPFNVINSTLSNNTTGGIGSGNGGGIGTGSGTLTVVNSTFHNNGAAGAGGAIHKNGSGSITVTNSTLTNNSASSGGGIGNQSGNPPQVRNTIIALNSSVSGPDVFGSFTSQGHNLIGMNDGSSGFTAGTSNPNGDLVGTVATPINPMLAALANNGGPTQTRALLQGSTAIDAGDNCVLTNSCVPALASAITNDQRGTGFGRSLDGNGDGNATVDIGAYEFRGILVTNTNDSGTGSLRQAIIDANANSDSSAINFEPGLTGTISLSTALPVLSTSMAINGPGAEVLTVQRSTDGGTPNFRIFTVASLITASISGMTITNGRTADGVPPASGSFGNPGDHGGGIMNSGVLTLTNMTITGNRTGNGSLPPASSSGSNFGGPGGFGGGIYSSGQLTMSNVTVSNNTTGDGVSAIFGGFGGRGGGIFIFSGSLTMTNCLVSGNVTGIGAISTNGSSSGGGGEGGGIYIQIGTTTLTNTSIINNTTGTSQVASPSNSGSGGGGGGIMIASGTSVDSGNITIVNSTIRGNRTGDGTGFSGQAGRGAGLNNGSSSNLTIIGTTISGNQTGNGLNGGEAGIGAGLSNTATTKIINSTISGNVAGTGNSGAGAGIWNAQNLFLTNSTVAFNSGGSFGGPGIHQFNNSSAVTLRNTIIAGNTLSGQPNAADLSPSNPAYNSQGHNLIGNADGATGFSPANGDQLGTMATPLNPQLSPLANDGGPTLTHALLANSPALDAGDNCVADVAHCGDGNLPQLPTDQRGSNRQVDGPDVDTTATVDIGAFEAQASVEDIAEKSMAEDTALSFGFNVGNAAAITNVTASSANTTLVPNLPANLSVTGSGSTRTLNITPAANQYGTSTITVTVTSGSESMSDTFVLTVTAVLDTPSVTPATTNEDTQTSSGLVVSRNAADGSEVTHFKITNITNGTLFKNNGVTQINNGDIITSAEGNAGLKFTPAGNLFSPATAFSFDVQGATDGSGGGLSPVAMATITVNPVGDAPSVTPANTIVNTQTTSGLVISRNVVDGDEVTHFKITNITNGTLFKNNGTTQITNNSFITFAEGNAGLRFTPATNLASPSSTFSFQVQGATSSGGAGLGPATTATITVNCGPTVVTNTNDSGVGSLRDTINTACPGATITFNVPTTDPGFSGGVYTITLTSAELVINKNLTITGLGANVLTVKRSSDGVTPQFRIFNIQNSTITLTGLTISGGFNNGGGAGILTNSGSTLNINGCVISGNTDNNFRGGGISSAGTLSLANSTVSGNTGSGIFTDGGVIAITNTTLNNNVGSAIRHQSPFPFSISNSTISGNSAGLGGGIFMSGGVLTMSNTTVSGNTALEGGGIFTGGGTTGDTLLLNNCTITGNRGTAGGFFTAGGIQTSGSLTLKNSIVAGNFKDSGTTPGDISLVVGSIQSASNNLIGDANSSGGITHGVNGNQVGNGGAGTININTVLAVALANNGGPTMSHMLLPGSPAINAGSNSNLPPDTFDLDGDSDTGEALPVDQRGSGFNRIVNTTVDIGAVEVNYTIAATAGTPQSATINSAFSTLLLATVKESGNNQSGIPVTFTPPASGPSGAFSGSSTVTTDASGIATAPVFTANGTAGGYNVVASLAGGSQSTNFALTNLKAATTTVVTSSVNPSEFGENVTFTATVSTADGVTPTGIVQFKDGPTDIGDPVTCLGASGNTCTAQLPFSSLSVGDHNISANYSGDSNLFPSSGSMSNTQVVKPQPTLSINDVSVTEGNSGTANLTFSVTLSAASHLTVSVKHDTADGTATIADNDYQSTSGTLTFNPGDSLTKTVTVSIIGDQKTEPDESFFVVLSNAVNAAFGDSQGQGTILNDDTLQLLLDTSGPDANQLAALDSLLLIRDPFRIQNTATWFTSEQNTRVILFALNLQLNSGESPSVVKIMLVDGNGQPHEVDADDVRTIPDTSFTQVVFRLPELAQGTCLVSIKAHQRISNTGTFRIAP